MKNSPSVLMPRRTCLARALRKRRPRRKRTWVCRLSRWWFGLALGAGLGFAGVGARAAAPNNPSVHVCAVDLDGDGAVDLAIARDAELFIRFQAARPESSWTRIPLDHHHWFETDSLHAGDLNQDGYEDLVLGADRANRVLVLFGQADRVRELEMQEIAVPGGPSGLDLIKLGSDAPGELLSALAVHTPSPRVTEVTAARGGSPEDPADLTITRMPFPVDALEMHEPLDFVTLPPKDDGGRLLAWLHRPPDSPTGELATALSWFERTATVPGIRRASNVTLKRGIISATATWMGGLQPDFAVIAWGPGLGEILLVHPPTPPEQPSAVEAIPLDYSHLSWHRLPGPTFEGRLLVARDLQRELAVYRWSDSGQLQLLDTVSPPPDQLFLGPAAWTDNGLAALLAGSDASRDSTNPHATAFYENRNGRLVFQFASTLPGFNPRPVLARVLIYDRDPFTDAGALQFAGLAAGDWARDARVTDGVVTAVTTSFRDSVLGLGGGSTQILELDQPLPSGAFALANQWEPSSSLFFGTTPALPGRSAVLPQPSPGSYPGPVQLTFRAGEGIRVFSRLGDGSWREGRGPIAIEQSQSVEFYGVDPTGRAGGRQIGRYLIVQEAHSPNAPLFSDLDADGLDDAWERMLFGSLAADPDVDYDGDGFSARDEHDAGTDPFDPASQPGGVPTPTLLLDVAFTSTGRPVMVWPGPASATYAVEASDDLSGWTRSPVSPEYRDGAHQWEDHGSNADVRFYRVVRLP